MPAIPGLSPTAAGFIPIPAGDIGIPAFRACDSVLDSHKASAACTMFQDGASQPWFQLNI